MRITFVALGWEQLGISLLSGIARSLGYEVNLAFSVALFHDRNVLNIPLLSPLFDDRGEVIAAIKKQKPDVLAFSVITANYQWMLDIAREAKEINPNVKVIFGGVHPSAVPDLVLAKPQIDYVVVGEGEAAFPQILKAIEEGGPRAPIPNTRYKLPDGQIVRGPQAGFIQDLDSLPLFDRTLWEEYMPYHDYYLTMASRGCPYRCTFCFNNFFAKLPEGPKGKYVRMRSPEHMMRELRIAKKRYNPKMIDFFDDVFTLDKNWLKEFLPMYKKEIGAPFECYTHVNFVDEETVKIMAEANCISFKIGIQSLHDDFKRVNLKRYECTDQVEKVLAWMKKYKIRSLCDHMLGLPGEALEAQESARKFYIEHTPYHISTFFTKLQPGTEIVQQALDLGLIAPQEVDRINEGVSDCDIYSNSNDHIDPAKIQTYKAYDIIFKLMPHLPKALRKRLDPKFFIKLPAPVINFLSLAADIVLGPDHGWYSRYYLFHMMRFFLRKLGFRGPGINKPLDDKGFDRCRKDALLGNVPYLVAQNKSQKY